MQARLESKRLTPINIKYHSPEVQAYYNEAASEWEKKKRSFAIKAYEIKACEFEDLPMVAAIIGRILGQFRRVGKGSYKAVNIPYKNVLEAAFAYFVDNNDHFYLRTRLAYEDDIKKYELHRRGPHYTSDSVFWLLKEAHKDVHSPYYVVQSHNIIGRYIDREVYRNKEILRNHYGLTKNQFESSLKLGKFTFNDTAYTIKQIKSTLETSFEELLEIERSILDAEKRSYEQAMKLDKEPSYYLVRKTTLESIALYEKLIEIDKAYNEKVKNLKGQSATELWNKRAEELKKNYNAQSNSKSPFKKD